MSEFQRLQTVVNGASRRRRWDRAWRGFWHGLLVAGVIWLLALATYKLLPVPTTVLLAAAALAALAALVGFVVGGWRSLTTLETARWLDQRQQLDERLSTALELGHDTKLGQWADLLVGDAARHLAEIDARRLLPFHLPRITKWTLLVLALGAGLGFVPEYRSREFRQKERDRVNVQDVGRRLAELSRRTLERRKPALEATRANINSVGELGDQLAKHPVVRSDALRDLAKMTDKVQQETKELAKNPALSALDRASRSAERQRSASADDLKSQMDALQKSLGGKEPNRDALDKLQRELQKAQQAAASLMNKDSRASDASKDSLAKALSSLAKQTQELGAALPSLEEAISALEAGKIDQLVKDLKVAEQDLDKLQQMAQALQQMQQQAAQLGKNLAEQLQNGQAEAAAATLDKMAKQLQSGALTPEQMKAIMDEVSKAIDPAQPYGKVASLLKQGGQQMQQGQRPGAAQSLAAAAKELRDLMQELADAQDLQSTLDALKRAQFAVGNCTGWGQCDGPPRAGRGGKPGKGVGTWTDDPNWMDPPQNEAWDNSGVQRPDADPRGLTDRGDGEVPDGLVPTKVKGKLSPGGPMPSITLKGVSIKGQSTVAVQEAVAAAQSEAQSALSHEQVPRAYQGAVKDYFDDIKK